jgi:prophage antirepressor-like protein
MELINQIDETFNFNDKQIRIIGTGENPWFIAKDICEILGLKDVSNALLNIPEKWKGTKVISTLGGKQDMRIINEPALYKLIMRSNKPIAQKFQEVVCEDILPSLRKKGEYKIQSIIDKNKKLEEERLKLEEELNNKSKEIKQLHTLVKKKERKKYSFSHSVYIISNPDIKNYYKIGFTKDRNQRLDGLASGAPRAYEIEYSRKLKNVYEETAIESLLLGIFDKYRVETITKGGKQREWVKGVNLNVLKKEMDSLVDYYNNRVNYFNNKFISNQKNEMKDDNEYVIEDEDEEAVKEDEDDDEDEEAVKEDEEDEEDDEDVEDDEVEDDEVEDNEDFEDFEDYDEDVEDDNKNMFKICYVCKEEKSLDEYYSRIENEDGKECTCKTCYSIKKKILKQEKDEREIIKREKGTKKCRTCLELKNINSFDKHGSSKDGYSYECIDCKTKNATNLESKKCLKCRCVKKIEEYNKFRLGYNKYCKTCQSQTKEEVVNEHMKKCSCCKKELSIDNYNKSKTSADGFSNYCNDCNKQKGKERRHKIKLNAKIEVSEKLCGSCNETKSVENFYKAIYEKDGYNLICKNCVKTNKKNIRISLTS